MRPAPRGIKYKRQERVLEIDWGAERHATHAVYDLRCECACALCVDENTGMRVLDPTTIEPDIGIERMDLVGNYAIQFQFTDGHDTGIYTWDRLDRLRP